MNELIENILESYNRMKLLAEMEKQFDNQNENISSAY